MCGLTWNEGLVLVRASQVLGLGQTDRQIDSDRSEGKGCYTRPCTPFPTEDSPDPHQGSILLERKNQKAE